ncbi:MAG: hypothetical protein K8R23_20045 [Chthoniobacter sp.]|nr:hypothetical protein [Chthoniobacter sp.]
MYDFPRLPRPRARRSFRPSARLGRVITGEHGIGLAKARWWPDAASPVSRAVHGALKTALDPLGILNPGKFV